MRQYLLFLIFTSTILLAQPPTIGSCSIFPADNIWNTPVDQLPVSPSSSTYVNTIGATTGVHPDFGSGNYNGGPIGIPYITVPGTQTKYPATFLYSSESDPGPYAIPLNAPIEGGSQSTGDRHTLAVDTDNCILYELWSAYPQASSWQAGSGAIFNTLSDALRPASWTSTDAAGLPILPGLVRYDEVLAGEIRHAVRFTVPHTLKAYVWPARHDASSLTDPKYPPMGARFRLRASFNISTFSPANQVILKALQKYGMMLADNGSAWYISGAPDSRWDNDDLHNLGAVKGSDFELVDVSPLMVDPNSGQALQAAVSVSVNPPSASVLANATKQFGATVANSTDPTVTWSVNGVAGGNATTGWINPAGLFTAPSVVPSPAAVTVQAASNAVPSAAGTSMVTITSPPPAPSPTSSSIGSSANPSTSGSTVTFTATVTSTTGVPSGTVTFNDGQTTLGSSTLAAGLATLSSSALSVGSHTITATFAGNNSYSASTSPVLVQTANAPSIVPGSVSFQNGAAGYTGAQDGTINNLYIQYSWDHGLGSGTVSSPSLDIRNTTNGVDSRALLKFTGISIPAGRTLTSASLTMTFVNWGETSTLNGYYLNTPWVPDSTSTFDWAKRGGGNQWAVPGASGDGSDRVSGKSFTVSGFVISGSDQITVPLDLATVQSWLNTPTANQGILLVNPTVGWIVSAISSEGSPAASRPILTLNYQ